MVLITLHIFLCMLHYFSSHTRIRINPVICFMTRKNRRRQSKDDFWGQHFKQHEVLGGLPNRSASTQRTILLYAAGTSYDLRKTHFSSLEGGRAMGAMLSGSALSHKGKNMASSWGFPQTLIFFLKIFLKALRTKTNTAHCRAHEK